SMRWTVSFSSSVSAFRELRGHVDLAINRLKHLRQLRSGQALVSGHDLVTVNDVRARRDCSREVRPAAGTDPGLFVRHSFPLFGRLDGRAMVGSPLPQICGPSKPAAATLPPLSARGNPLRGVAISL